MRTAAHRTEEAQQAEEAIKAFGETIPYGIELSSIDRRREPGTSRLPEACLWKDLTPPQAPALERATVDAELLAERRQSRAGQSGREGRD